MPNLELIVLNGILGHKKENGSASTHSEIINPHYRMILISRIKLGENLTRYLGSVVGSQK